MKLKRDGEGDKQSRELRKQEKKFMTSVLHAQFIFSIEIDFRFGARWNTQTLSLSRLEHTVENVSKNEGCASVTCNAREKKNTPQESAQKIHKKLKKISRDYTKKKNMHDLWM